MKNTRRGFIKNTLAASGIIAFPSIVRATNLNSRLTHACIGTGGKGESDWKNIIRHEKTDIVAACDVDTSKMNSIKNAVPGIRAYQDWRELFEKEGDKIDSVNISTPDHMHTIIAVNAMRRGKHVYCQKPLCRGLNESKLLFDVAKKSGVVTEIGAQVTGDGGDRSAVEWLRSGVIGDIEKVYMYLNIKGYYRLPRYEVPMGEDPIPSTLNWDQWLGTAPVRKYKKSIYHPGRWRSWLDFGSSSMGDNGLHMMSATWLGMELGADFAPISVRGEADPQWMKFDEKRKRQIWPVGNHVVWKFPGVKASGGKPFTMEWCDGIPEENPPAEFLPTSDAIAAAQKMRMKSTPVTGKMIRGSKGWMMLSHGSMPVVLLHDGTRLKAPKVQRGVGHYHDYLNHCINGTRGALDFVLRGTSMQDTLLLGNAAELVPGVELKWDAKKRIISNSEEATKFLYPQYREGWTLEGLA
jgi:hypothetical protein